MDKYDFDRQRVQTWQGAAWAALVGQQTKEGAVRSADAVLKAFEDRFPVTEEEKRDE